MAGNVYCPQFLAIADHSLITGRPLPLARYSAAFITNTSGAPCPRDPIFADHSGEIAAPIADMRFDESLYRALGENLAALTRETHVMPETGTYFCRGLGGIKVPGMLIEDFRFAL